MREGWGAGSAEHLLQRFLVGRRGSTARAYTLDIDDVARFLELRPAEAVSRLLSGSAAEATTLLREYAVSLRQRGLAPATARRRLGTLRALAGAARDLGLIQWSLEMPTEDEVAEALEARSAGKVPYLLPRHRGEIDRLDLQHYAFKEAIGSNYLAPVRNPARVLDVGSGTGQWGFEMTEEFPDALVVGVDLVPGKPVRPPMYQPVRADLLSGLPFVDGRFDYVHQRLLFLAVPVNAWPSVVADLARVTRPGGWIELSEPPIGVRGSGPAIERLLSLTAAGAAARGLDTTSAVFDSLDGYLRDAGLVDVTRRELWLPVGEWGGRVGSLMATDFRSAFSRLCEVLQAMGTLTAEEARDLLQEVQQEYEHRQVLSGLAVAFGRKPG